MQRLLIVLLVITSLFINSSISIAQIEFTEHSIETNFNKAVAVYAVDIDSDGDIDVLGSAYDDDVIAWWENDGNQNFTRHTISDDFDGAAGIYAVDLDEDGDLDVLAAGYHSNKISIWVNDGEQDFTETILKENFELAITVFAADMDADGDMDILGGARTTPGFTWWENFSIYEFDEHTIEGELAGDYFGNNSVYATDIDSDGDMDVLGADYNGDAIILWENDGEQGFDEHIMKDEFYHPYDVHADDIDGDSDMDVISANYYGITWWENDSDQEFTEHTINDDFEGAKSVYTADIDNDGDMDLLGAASRDNFITWWENDGEQDFTRRTIARHYYGAFSVHVADVDSDGDLDVLGTAFDGNVITWWESDLDPLSVKNDGFVLIPNLQSLSAYPNPFNSQTHVSFSLPHTGSFQLNLFDLGGRQLYEITRGSGVQQQLFDIPVDATALPSGKYIIQLNNAGATSTYPMTLIK